MTEARPNLSVNRGLAGKVSLELSGAEKGTERVQPQQLGLGLRSALRLRPHDRGGIRSLPKRIVTSVGSLGV